MPKEPKNPNHPIRKLRGIIDKKQYAFAAMIGVSPDYLKKIENGERAFSADIAKQISVATGVDDRALLKGRLKDIFGAKYTSAQYQDWRTPNICDAKRSQQLVTVGGIIAPLEILLRVAKDKGDFWPVIAWFEQRLDECRRLFDLSRRTDAVMQREIEPKLREIARRWKRDYPKRGRYGYAHYELMDAFWRNQQRVRYLREYRAWRHKSRAAIRQTRRSSRVPVRA
jgi:transcriptional regulator with XRE-family HTH domain